MNKLSRITVIYNPNSTGPSKEKAEDLLRTLEQHGSEIATELIATERAGHATDLAYEIAKTHERPLIVSSSGDGGYNEVINGALRAQSEGAHPVCAVLPAGNANDHRRTVKRRPLSEAIAQGAVERLDVLMARIERSNGTEEVRYAHSYIGVGLTPAIAVELNRSSLSRLKETFIVLKSLHEFHPVEVIVDGDTIVVDSLIFANISQMAKVLTIAENAKPDDGKIKVVAFPYKHKAWLLFMLLRAALFGLKGKSGKSYEFTTVKDMALQFDGEIVDIGAGDIVTVSALPGGLATLR